MRPPAVLTRIGLCDRPATTAWTARRTGTGSGICAGLWPLPMICCRRRDGQR